MTCFKETNDRDIWMIMFTIAKKLTPPTFTCKKKILNSIIELCVLKNF